MKEFIQTECFWYQKGNPDRWIDETLEYPGFMFEKQEAGCRYGGSDDIRPCEGICTQFFTYDKKTVKMLKGKHGGADYQKAREWQADGRPKPKEKKEMKK